MSNNVHLIHNPALTPKGLSPSKASNPSWSANYFVTSCTSYSAVHSYSVSYSCAQQIYSSDLFSMIRSTHRIKPIQWQSYSASLHDAHSRSTHQIYSAWLDLLSSELLNNLLSTYTLSMSTANLLIMQVFYQVKSNSKLLSRSTHHVHIIYDHSKSTHHCKSTVKSSLTANYSMDLLIRSTITAGLLVM